MPQQRPGSINGSAPLIYEGSVPNLVTSSLRPTPKNFQGFAIGSFWIIPKKLPSAPSSDPSEEVWILLGKQNNMAQWFQINGSSHGSGVVINQIILDTPGSGTYTPTVGMLQCYVECIGGGGAASTMVSDGQYAWSTTGGGGAYTAKLYNSTQIGSSVAYVIGSGGIADVSAGNHDGGDGGDTTFLGMTAGGGSGGSNTIPANATNVGGVGGLATGGDLNIDGFAGESPVNYFPGGLPDEFLGFSGGGRSFYSRGPSVNYALATASGHDGLSGAGGGGAIIQHPTGQALGGNGGNGLIIITEYIG
jgi:hypothetical protein